MHINRRKREYKQRISLLLPLLLAAYFPVGRRGKQIPLLGRWFSKRGRLDIIPHRVR